MTRAAWALGAFGVVGAGVAVLALGVRAGDGVRADTGTPTAGAAARRDFASTLTTGARPSSTADLAGARTPLRVHAAGARPGRAAPPAFQAATVEEFEAWAAMVARELPHVPRDDYGKWHGFCPADMDKNDIVDAADATFFARLWQDESHELTGWADVNADGWIDAGDVIEFMHRYIEQDCDPAQKVTERSMWC